DQREAWHLARDGSGHDPRIVRLRPMRDEHAVERSLRRPLRDLRIIVEAIGLRRSDITEQRWTGWPHTWLSPCRFSRDVDLPIALDGHAAFLCVSKADWPSLPANTVSPSGRRPLGLSAA